MSSHHLARIAEFQNTLDADEVNLCHLKNLCFSGCPDERGLRPLCWRLLLGYLPSRRSEWQSVLKRQRDSYAQFLSELIVKPGHMAQESGDRMDVTMEDHPLNPNPDSSWLSYFKDNEMLLQIDRDCRRLCPDLSFFQQATPHPCDLMVHNQEGFETLRKRVDRCVLKSQTLTSTWKGNTNLTMSSQRRALMGDLHTLSDGEEAHWEVCERILFVYAKLNPGLSYVQGMNELLGPIYYCFASDPVTEWSEHTEADAFYCFTSLMSQVRDNFIKTLDDSNCGIGFQMELLLKRLKSRDTRLWLRLDEQELKPQYYAFRWLTLLLSQELPLPDILRLWDSLLADENWSSFLIDVCCAMILLVRDNILKNDFPANMKLLQNYPPCDIQTILARAVQFRNNI